MRCAKWENKTGAPQGWWEGSVSKATCCQTWWLESPSRPYVVGENWPLLWRSHAWCDSYRPTQTNRYVNKLCYKYQRRGGLTAQKPLLWHFLWKAVCVPIESEGWGLLRERAWPWGGGRSACRRDSDAVWPAAIEKPPRGRPSRRDLQPEENGRRGFRGETGSELQRAASLWGLFRAPGFVWLEEVA